jgi:hypothetical protein
MKIWKINATIETDDDMTAEDIYRVIGEYLNNGSGWYLDLDTAKIDFVKEVDDD